MILFHGVILSNILAFPSVPGIPFILRLRLLSNEFFAACKSVSGNSHSLDQLLQLKLHAGIFLFTTIALWGMRAV
jgi:hypothetical protein